MQVPRKEAKGVSAYARPLLGVFLLITCYFVLSEWQELPALIGSAMSSVH